MISLLIGILIIVVVGAICFWAIEKFIRDGRLANLLKLLVVLICLASILQRVLPRRYDPFADAVEPGRLQQHLAQLRHAVRAAALQMPEHDDFVARHCPAPTAQPAQTK